MKDLPAELGGVHSSAPFPFPAAVPAPPAEPAPLPPPAAPPATAPTPRPLAELLDEVYARLSATGEPMLPFLEREMNARAGHAPTERPAPAAKTAAKGGKARR